MTAERNRNNKNKLTLEQKAIALNFLFDTNMHEFYTDHCQKDGLMRLRALKSLVYINKKFLPKNQDAITVSGKFILDNWYLWQSPNKKEAVIEKLKTYIDEKTMVEFLFDRITKARRYDHLIAKWKCKDLLEFYTLPDESLNYLVWTPLEKAVVKHVLMNNVPIEFISIINGVPQEFAEEALVKAKQKLEDYLNS